MRSTAADLSLSPAQPNSHCIKLLSGMKKLEKTTFITVMCSTETGMCPGHSRPNKEPCPVQQEPRVALFCGTNHQILN